MSLPTLSSPGTMSSKLDRLVVELRKIQAADATAKCLVFSQFSQVMQASAYANYDTSMHSRTQSICTLLSPPHPPPPSHPPDLDVAPIGAAPTRIQIPHPARLHDQKRTIQGLGGVSKRPSDHDLLAVDAGRGSGGQSHPSQPCMPQSHPLVLIISYQPYTRCHLRVSISCMTCLLTNPNPNPTAT